MIVPVQMGALRERLGMDELLRHWSLVCGDPEAVQTISVVVDALIDYLGDLPFHPARYASSGGALLAVARSGRHAANLAQHMVFGDPLSAAWRKAAPFWRAAAIIAALLPWAPVAAASVGVWSEGGAQWDGAVEGIGPWLERNGEGHVYWLSPPNASNTDVSFTAALDMVPLIGHLLLPPEVRTRMEGLEGNPLRTICSTWLNLHSHAGSHSQDLLRVVEATRSHVLQAAIHGDRESATQAAPLPLMPILVGAIRDAVDDPNRCVSVREGVARIGFPHGLDFIAAALARHGVVYHSHHALLQLLFDYNLIISVDPETAPDGTRALVLASTLVAYPDAGPALFPRVSDTRPNDPPAVGKPLGAEPLGAGHTGTSGTSLPPSPQRTAEQPVPTQRNGESAYMAEEFVTIARAIARTYARLPGAIDPEGWVWVRVNDIRKHYALIEPLEIWMATEGLITPCKGGGRTFHCKRAIDGQPDAQCYRFSQDKLRAYLRQNARTGNPS